MWIIPLSQLLERLKMAWLSRPGFLITRACFSGSGFSWILIGHVLCVCRKTFFLQIMWWNLMWIEFFELQSFMLTITATNIYGPFHFDWFRFAPFLSEISFTLLLVIQLCSWLLNIHTFHYSDHSAQSPLVQIFEVWL